jgi:hypothetical protein
LVYVDPYGEVRSSLDAAIEACMRRPTIALQLECLKDLVPVFEKDYDVTKLKNLIAKLKPAAACEAIWLGYHAVESTGKCSCHAGMTLKELIAASARIGAIIAGRLQYIN